MIQLLPVIAMQFVGAVALMTIIGIMISSNLYDVRLEKMAARNQKANRKRRASVSVVILADRFAGPLTDTLDSVRTNGYKNIEIIVADDASKSHARRTVSSYAKRYDGLQLFCLVKNKAIGEQRCVHAAMDRYGSGELVVWLKAGDTLAHGTILHMVSRLQGQPVADIVRPRTAISQQRTLASTLKAYQLTCDNTVLKSLSLMQTGSAFASRGIMRVSALSKPVGQAVPLFASDIEVTDGTVWTISRFYRDNASRAISFYGSIVSRSRRIFSKSAGARVRFLLPVAVLNGIAGLVIPILICYFIYLALYLLQPVFLGVTLAALVILLLYCIWGEDTMSLGTRLRFSAGIPLTFIAGFLLSFVPLVSLLSSRATD